MSKYSIIAAVLLSVSLPAVLYALDMGGYGGMGGMGAMVDKVEIHTKTVGDVIFSHRLHGTSCNTCHPKIFEKKANFKHFTMKAMERGQACGACHNGRRAFSVKSNCTKCHAGDILFKNEDAGNVVFSHEVHIGMFGCEECHPDLFKAKQGANKMTMADMEEGQYCGACHDGSTAFSVSEDCDSCHQSS